MDVQEVKTQTKNSLACVDHPAAIDPQMWSRLLKHNYREWKSGRLSQEVRIREKKRGYVVLHFLYSSIFFSLFSSKMHVYMHACVHNRGL